MDILLGFAIWYMIGAIGSALILEFGFRRDGHPVTVGALWLGAFLALTGPVAVVVFICIFASWAICNFVDFDRVILPARKRK